jgi:hypothetical protein
MINKKARGKAAGRGWVSFQATNGIRNKNHGALCKAHPWQEFSSTGNRKDDAVYGCTHITDSILLERVVM